jgi:YHS domain-containing protein
MMKVLNRVLTVLSITLLSSVCFAGSWISGATDGVAIQGYDPVAYFTQKNAIKGSAKNSHEWGGTVWFFVSSKNRDLFAADPEKYAPQYGGHCALSVANGKNGKGAGDAWTISDDKLYLNASKEVRSRWLQKVSQNIYWADREWPKIKERLVAK